ncbi:MAG: ATP-grasp domain-containing protein, partial [Desulfobulbaceae bacterium]|nr:ATP-grasp domain-containing protein [Desulfobulbaceae bacterium]
FFTNFTYNPEVYYFLYIGELKSYGLNHYLSDMFAGITGRRVEFVAIITDILSQYNYRNLVVFSPRLKQSQKTNGNHVSFRTAPEQFVKAVSSHPVVLRIIKQILTRQNHLYINMYESEPHMILDELENVSLLGPDKELARKFNNKAVQLELLKAEIPVVDFRICQSMQDLLDVSEKLRKQWQDGIFVSRMYSAAGAGSAITHSIGDIIDRFSGEDSRFLISRYVPHDFDPTVLGVVANDKDVYIAGVADQRIEDGNRFVGSAWPSILPVDIIDELKEYTRRVGRMIGSHGYRGIFGCDFIVDRENQVKFLEINARKQGTTLEFCYTLEQLLPEGSPSLPELEYFAVQQHRFPVNAVELERITRPLCWGTYNYKLKEEEETCGYIPQNPYEREAFRKVARGELFKDFVILEHIGSKQVVLPGTFLARAVAVAGCHEDVQEGLQQAREMIELTIRRT